MFIVHQHTCDLNEIELKQQQAAGIRYLVFGIYNIHIFTDLVWCSLILSQICDRIIRSLQYFRVYKQSGRIIFPFQLTFVNHILSTPDGFHLIKLICNGCWAFVSFAAEIICLFLIQFFFYFLFFSFYFHFYYNLIFI